MNNLIHNLSPHLFWDVDTNDVDADKNKSFIIKRVLEYGFLEDWQLINKFYNRDQIIETAIGLRELEPKAFAFMVHFSGKPKDQFRCYTTTQSKVKHWNF